MKAGPAVAQYFFEVRANGHAIVDDEGYESASAQDACEQVLAALADIAKHRPSERSPTEVAITARDGTGHEVFTASLSLRVEWSGSPLLGVTSLM